MSKTTVGNINDPSTSQPIKWRLLWGILRPLNRGLSHTFGFLWSTNMWMIMEHQMFITPCDTCQRMLVLKLKKGPLCRRFSQIYCEDETNSRQMGDRPQDGRGIWVLFESFMGLHIYLNVELPHNLREILGYMFLFVCSIQMRIFIIHNSEPCFLTDPLVMIVLWEIIG